MKKVLAGLVLTSGTFFAGSASATMIMNWDWATDGGFVVGGSTCSNGGEAACNIGYDNTSGATPSGIAGTASVMTWGTGTTMDNGNGEQSGLQAVFGTSTTGPYNAQLLGSDPIDIPAFTQIETNAGWFNTGAAIHYNNVIMQNGGYMDTSTLRTSFQLLTPGPGPVNTIDLDIDFFETPNSPSIPNCFGENPHGTRCDDVFTLSQLPPPIVFYIGNIRYTVSFQFADGPGAIVIGNEIWTAELNPGTGVVFTQARIDAQAVPVPGVLALMGLGLMMLGWRRRERVRQAA